MSFTQYQLVKAKSAKSAEELYALAKENGVELTEDEVKKYFAEWHKEGELSDDELQNVSGGCGADVPSPKYYEGQVIFNISGCKHAHKITAVSEYDPEYNYRYHLVMQSHGRTEDLGWKSEKTLDESFSTTQ